MKSSSLSSTFGSRMYSFCEPKTVNCRCAPSLASNTRKLQIFLPSVTAKQGTNLHSLQDMLSLEELCSYLGFLFGLFRNNTGTLKKQIIILPTSFQKRLIFHSTSHKTWRNLGCQKHVSLIKYENKIQMRVLYFHSQIVMHSVETGATGSSAWCKAGRTTPTAASAEECRKTLSLCFREWTNKECRLLWVLQGTDFQRSDIAWRVGLQI